MTTERQMCNKNDTNATTLAELCMCNISNHKFDSIKIPAEYHMINYVYVYGKL